jgi:2-desacetyl-2-hydroxyethyl bacteriochlorophyllide A dehydrogenase
MKALVFHGPNDVRAESVPDPTPHDENGAVVRIEATGICGSDLHLYHGAIAAEPGFVIGHEFVGEIVETGSGVSEFRTGDKVIVPGVIGCGLCAQCSAGQVTRCEQAGTRVFGQNAELQGGQAEAAAVPMADSHLLHLPDGVDWAQAVLLTDILPTGYFGALNAEIEPGQDVVILGLGPVGIMALQTAQLFGPARVFAVDLVPERLAYAKTLGAIPIEASPEGLAEIRELTGGQGPDAVIEAVGADATVQTALELVRIGGVVSVVGVNLNHEFPFPLDLAFMKSLTFRIGLVPVIELWDPLVPLVASGRLKPEHVFSHEMSLDQGSEAYRLFDARKQGVRKILLRPGK